MKPFSLFKYLAVMPDATPRKGERGRGGGLPLSPSSGVAGGATGAFGKDYYRIEGSRQPAISLQLQTESPKSTLAVATICLRAATPLSPRAAGTETGEGNERGGFFYFYCFNPYFLFPYFFLRDPIPKRRRKGGDLSST